MAETSSKVLRQEQASGAPRTQDPQGWRLVSEERGLRGGQGGVRPCPGGQYRGPGFGFKGVGCHRQV